MKQEPNLTLADKLHELTFRPYNQFGANAKLKRDPQGFAALKRSMIDLRMKLRTAKRFVLDDEFLTASVKASATDAGIIAHYSELAQLPFPVVWIEYDGAVRNNAQEGMDEPPAQIGRSGFLLAREQPVTPTELPVWTASYVTTTDAGDAGMGGIQYRLRCPVTHKKPSTNQVSEDFGAWAWGYMREVEGKPAIAFYPELEHLASIEPDPYFIMPHIRAFYERIRDLVQYSIQEGKGDMRWLVTMLTMINHVPISYREVKAGPPRVVRLRNIPALSYSTVQIVAGAPRVISIPDRPRGDNRESVRHRQHDVRGFNRVLHKGTERERTTFVREHKRGDPRLGVVVHDYKVVKKPM